MYFSESSQEDWGANLLNGYSLPDGNYFDIQLNISNGCTVWDIAIEDASQTPVKWYDVNISKMPASGFGIEFLWDESEYSIKFVDISDSYIDTTPDVSDPNADTWAVYWYLCGSDLESDLSAATKDLHELQSTILPDNVKVVIETGGALKWNHEAVQDGQLGRYVYDSSGLNFVDAQPEANMGDPQTLANFLLFCEQNYPADHTMLIFWNHGGGSTGGVAYDEVYNMDSLTLNEIYLAFNSVNTLWQKSPLDIVGFDACLMATIDTAGMLADVARYMVASQENEPACGWSYDKWVQALGSYPEMDGAQLGAVICDSYIQGCEQLNIHSEATMSVTDLQKIKPLISAYETLGKEALLQAYENPLFLAWFCREAYRTENYGVNTPESGYTNTVDLGHLVRNSSYLLPQTSQAVLQALDECIVYQVQGPYRQEATGVSCYYPYSNNPGLFQSYYNSSVSRSFPYLYEYEYNGILSEDIQDYLGLNDYDDDFNIHDEYGYNTLELSDSPLYVDDDGYAVLDFGQKLLPA